MLESVQLGQNYVGTEHILLGLLREGDGVAAQVLVKLGADLNRVRQQVIQLVDESGKLTSRLLPDDALARIDTLDHRLAAIERWTGMRPDLDERRAGPTAGHLARAWHRHRERRRVGVRATGHSPPGP
jgi:ClpA/ClpB-like protein